MASIRELSHVVQFDVYVILNLSKGQTIRKLSGGRAKYKRTICAREN